MATITRILCPIDFSDFSRRALDYALMLARWHGASLTAMHVHQAPPPTVGALAAPEAMPLSLTNLDLVRRQIAAFLPPHAAVAVEPRAAEGDPSREILAEAASADLIVMGAHGRSGVERVVLGSVAEAVLRKSPCTVLTIPLSARGRRARFPSRSAAFLRPSTFPTPRWRACVRLPRLQRRPMHTSQSCMS
jgi:nucleotide-binding universal stress UspA family protein